MSKFALAFLLFFFGGIIATLFYQGWAAFIVYQLVYFLNPDNRWWSASIPGLRYSFITVLLMLMVFAVRYQYYNKLSPWREQACFKWMVLLLVSYYVAKLYALDPLLHDIATFEFAKLVIIMLVAYKVIDSRKALDFAIWGYVTGAFYIGYLATITGRNSGDRVEGIGMIDAPDANDTAAALVPAAALLMYLAWQGGKYTRIASVVMGAFIANGIVLINSRGSFLGVVASLGLFLAFMIFSKHQKKGQRGTAILMIVIGLSGALYVTDDAFWERMSTLQKDEETGERGGAGRVYGWLQTFKMLENRSYGLGVSGFNRLSSLYLPPEKLSGVANRAVHSSWFQGLSEIGYHGITIYFLMMFALFRQSWLAKKYLIEQKDYKNYFRVLALEAALIGYMVAATFIDRFRAVILYWMILFLMLAIKFYYLQPVKEQAELEQKETKAARKNARSLASG